MIEIPQSKKIDCFRIDNSKWSMIDFWSESLGELAPIYYLHRGQLFRLLLLFPKTKIVTLSSCLHMW